MPVSAKTLKALHNAGVTGDALIAVVEAIDADMGISTNARQGAAERQKRYRARQKAEEQKRDESDVTGDVTESVTPEGSSLDGFSPDPFSLNPSFPPKENTPKGVQKKAPHYPENFDEFWKTYPKHAGSKADAAKKYEAATKLVTHAEILTAAKQYADYIDETDTPVAHATTWLNQRRWEVDYQGLTEAERGKNGSRPDNTTRKSAVELVREAEQRGEI